ncbi:MAG TPA: sporulation integral membrane protein YtvI [Lachnospiraceae bacterium]|nr:sporulation integral membrane protein YtvI [Lachnospiraceae bacterium]
MKKPLPRTYGKAVMNLGIALLVLLLIIFLLPKLIVFFMPFVIGWIIALIANPIVHFFENKLKVRRKAGTAFVIIAVIALVVLAGYLIGARIVEEAIGLVTELPSMWDALEEDFRTIGKNLDSLYSRLPENLKDTIAGIGAQMEGFVGDIVGRVGTPTIEAVGNFAKNLPTIIIGIIMCLLSAYFFVAEREYLSVHWKENMPEAVTYRWNMMSRSFKRAVGGYFKAQFKIEIWMYLLLLTGLWILKVNYAFLIALGIAFLDFLPVFGTGTVLMPWAVIKILSADYRMAVGLMIIWCGGQLARQIIQPKIVGDSIGVAPIPTIFLLFIGYKAAGVFGMIIAVPIGIIFVNMYEEGVFDTTMNSIKILLAGINNFRRLEEEDLSVIKEYEEYQKEKSRQKEESGRKNENESDSI